MSYFPISELTKTNTGLPNIPESNALPNLSALAILLADVYEQIGPFTITSAYRSSAVNSKVGGASGSLHMQGRAADLKPTGMTPMAFFEKIAKSPLRAKMGEIINEAERGIVHISLPTSEMVGVLKYLQDGSYFRYGSEQVQALVGSVRKNPKASLLIFSLVLGGTIYLLRKKR